MEAPEKIYLHESELTGIDYDEEWSERPCGGNNIEYTRTDTFIEKACKWLGPVFKDYYGGAELLNDFKNYMKGE